MVNKLTLALGSVALLAATLTGATPAERLVITEGGTPDSPRIYDGGGSQVAGITVTAPRGGDGDGIRFFGNDIAIVDNVIRETSNEDGRHADRMQTFSDDTPPSQRRSVATG